MTFDLEPEDIERIAAAVADRLATTTETNRWLSRAEAADYLRCTPKTLDCLVRRGEIPVYRPTSRPLFRQSELDAFVERST